MTSTIILGVRIDAQRFSEAIETLLDWAAGANKYYVSTCTVYTIMMSEQNPDVQAALAAANMVTADGMPLVWLQRWRGCAAERVYGPDVLLQLCQRTSARGDRHFFLGGQPGVAERLADTLRLRFPGLQIAGVYCPPGDALDNFPDVETLARINDARPNVVWVGLGSPKQDLWMYLYRPHLDTPLMIGVGAAFDFISGVKPQAPAWMQRAGLEWLFRLAMEPRRLWRRYLVYNGRFLTRLFQSYVVDRKKGSGR